MIYFFARNYVDGENIYQLSTISFNTISIISGTGYVSDNFIEIMSVLFLFLMFSGCVGSTLEVLKYLDFKFYLNISFFILKNASTAYGDLRKFNGKKVRIYL